MKENILEASGIMRYPSILFKIINDKDRQLLIISLPHCTNSTC